MKFNHYRLGQQPKGAVVEVTLKGSSANVRLMDSHNLSLYKRGKQHRYYGGLPKRSPFHITVPRSGQWHITVDMQGLKGSTRSSARVLPSALPPVKNQSSDLASLVRRGPTAPSIGSTSPSYDVFISHASEDKAIVRELVIALQEKGLTVWFDEISMQIGDSLRRSIDSGLSNSRFGIVIVSPEFMAKPWTNYELDGIVSSTLSGKQQMLPIWHNVRHADVLKYSPSLADKLARSTSDVPILDIADEIASVVLALGKM